MSAEQPPAPIICVVGARPNYMKMAPIMRALSECAPSLPVLLVHTGQHYDTGMNDRLFADLALPQPDVNLEVGSASHAVQTGEIMKRFDAVIDTHGARAVVVVGDVNSTLACALVAAKRGVPVAHVEAGLRSFDRSMPEEINRVLTDQMADVLYTTERAAQSNLEREGIEAGQVQFVGNVMIDSLLANLSRAVPTERILEAAGQDPARVRDGYGVVTLHRPSNVDARESLEPIVEALQTIARRVPLVFAMHPRTRKNLERFGLYQRIVNDKFILIEPQGYLEMLGLMSGSVMVLTDSGGMQEETTALGVPCLTVRENTERPITIEQGTNTLVGLDPDVLIECAQGTLASGGKRGRVPELWDGKAAERIAKHLAAWLEARESQCRDRSPMR